MALFSNKTFSFNYITKLELTVETLNNSKES